MPGSTPPQYRSIAELQKAYDRGTTVTAVTEQYLATIESLKDLNAITIINPQAMEEAKQLDALPTFHRGPLFGLPIVIKDQIETAGMPTAYGNKACSSYIPPQDATLVRKLKQAGALILAKTTMPDFAASWFSMSSLSGTTRHPTDPSRDPGGSSSGSGTAVAAGMALAAIGGDTGGSIRLPSSFCGLVGVKVTAGRISRDGMSSLVLTQDTPGPMCWCVEDAARILDVLIGWDERDEFTSINAYAAFPGKSRSSTAFVDAVRDPVLKGRRLGVLRQVFGEQKGVNDVMDRTMEELKVAGVTNIAMIRSCLWDWRF